MVKNLPSSAGGAGLIPDWETKIPHAMGQNKPSSTTTREAHELQQKPSVAKTTTKNQTNKKERILYALNQEWGSTFLG